MNFPFTSLGFGLLFMYWLLRLESPRGYRFRIWDLGVTVLGAALMTGLYKF